MKFRRNLTGQLVEDYMHLLNSISQWKITSQNGVRLWKWDAKNQFTVRSYYKFLNFGGISFDASKVWAISVPLKVRILIWLISKEKLNALDLLAHKNIRQNGPCIAYKVHLGDY